MEEQILKELKYQTKLLETMVEHLDANQRQRQNLDLNSQVKTMVDTLLANPMVPPEARTKITDQLKSMGIVQ